MKTLLFTYLLFLTTLLGAGIPDGPAYDLYLYHGKAQLDYEGSGSKNHGRTLPYTFVGSVTSWAMRNGATVTFRGNDARIVKRNTSDPCESWDTNDTETENGDRKSVV